MTTDTDLSAPTGIIGTRQLLAVQTFGIARLTSDPVVLTPGRFIAVTGRGPKDSNESGKTSFLAAVSLLLGDPEWQVTGNGTANATSLLFEPVIAGASAHLVGGADRGYIVGVFADPAGERPHTVWLQISNDKPHIQVRHQAGVHLLTQGSDNERHDAAPEFYRQLGSEPLGSSEYSARLYGRSPKVLAYVASRGQVRSRPSLLKLEAATYSPDRIGDALITLSGRSSVLERDKKQRRELEEKQAEYKGALEKHAEDLVREDEILRAVATRADLRAKVRSAEADQEASLARGVLDATARMRSAKALLPAAEERLQKARDTAWSLRQEHKFYSNARELEQAEHLAYAEKDRLDQAWLAARLKESTADSELKTAEEALKNARTLSVRHAGESSTELTVRLEKLANLKAKAELDRSVAERDAKLHEEELHKAEQGQAGLVGQIIQILGDVGITAVGLHDQIEVDDQSRDSWEAALHPWRDAVCVPHTALPDALGALKDLPGAVLVTSPDLQPDEDKTDTLVVPLPPGIQSAPAAARGFLHALSERNSWTEEPPHATMHALGVHIIGTFPTPVVGREALCAHLRERRDAARIEVDKATEQLQHLDTRITVTQSQLTYAKAAEELPELLERQTAATSTLTQIREALPQLKTQLDEANSDWANAKAAVTGRKERISLLEQEIDRTDKLVKELGSQQAELATAAQEGAVQQAQADFGGDEEAARLLLNWTTEWLPQDYDELLTEAPQPQATGADGQPSERRPVGQLRMAAMSSIEACRGILQLEARTKGYPTSALARAVQMDDTNLEARAEAVLRALSDWLTDTEAADAAAEPDVAAVRKTRKGEHEFIAASVAALSEELRNTQAVITQRVTSALDNIAAALNKLDHDAEGFGADLLYQIDPPSDTDHSWRCAVTPRWRRNPNGPLLPYDTVTNTAQEKLFSINLVLAALLAAPNAQGRLLILDELGDSLGQEHRREVLAAISTVAAAHGITVLGTCQDTIMKDVAPVCGEILYFHYPSKSDYLNLPTRMFGFDADARRVELTAEELLRSST
ncbi:coiled-coil domain-containing protein [Sphaerimonospora thailandensis]|uniref:Chromosome segregation ATPase n=1 Tax=Sphaerimonospora thailandensis TaxID=795644 RepID=A0A8J3RCX1_9ACTN|nr:hypothetical protein [Sphaerimonospora thailandensis]GIH73432.1 hypothetical protein Mth01_56850 [Sphaerimonospora thailandensis]